MENFSSSGERHQPPTLKQFESFDQDEAVTHLTVLLHEETHRSLEEQILTMTTPQELDAMLNASVKYAEMSQSMDGFRIESPSRHIIDTILPISFDVAQRQLISSGPSSVRRVRMEMRNDTANDLKQIADTHDCLMGDVLTVGLSLRNPAVRHHKAGNRIIAIMTDSDRQFAILPLS